MGHLNEHSFADRSTPGQLRCRGETPQRASPGQVNVVFTHSGACLPSIHAAIPKTARDGAAVLPERIQAESQDPQNSRLILVLTPKCLATYTFPLATPALHVNVPRQSSPASGLSNLVLISF